MIKNKNILFNNNNFNLVLSCKDANDFVSKSGDTLREEIDDDTRVKSVLKNYANTNLKISVGINV